MWSPLCSFLVPLSSLISTPSIFLPASFTPVLPLPSFISILLLLSSSLFSILSSSVLDDGWAPAVDHRAYDHYGLDHHHRSRLRTSWGENREAGPSWHEGGIPSGAVQAEKRLDLELSLCRRGETCIQFIQDRTGTLILAVKGHRQVAVVLLWTNLY